MEEREEKNPGRKGEDWKIDSRKRKNNQGTLMGRKEGREGKKEEGAMI